MIFTQKLSPIPTFSIVVAIASIPLDVLCVKEHLLELDLIILIVLLLSLQYLSFTF